MDHLLQNLSRLPAHIAWLLFLIENVAITCIVLLIGRAFYKAPYTTRDWTICAVTNLLNTVVTYAGFWLWQHHLIQLTTGVSWWIALDFLLLFLAMDLLMFLFHVLIHKTFLYRAVHTLHHEAVDPTPIDLFVLHPIETIGFGSLWLALLLAHTFNIYAIAIYLIVNVIFGLIGHLGMEPIPQKILQLPGMKYLGTSTFHHNHHQDVNVNFGFYTSIWDRLFGTYKYHP